MRRILFHSLKLMMTLSVVLMLKLLFYFIVYLWVVSVIQMSGGGKLSLKSVLLHKGTLHPSQKVVLCI